MNYLVMECHPAYAVVLDPEGRMMKVANLGYEEGQTVAHVIVQQIPKAPILFRIAPLAVAVCLCLAVFGGGAYGAYRMPYGTVELKINPDVEMSVSYMDRVVGLKGLNEDGQLLIENMTYKGKTSEDTTGRLVERAIEMGYLSEGGDVYVTADSGNARWAQKRTYAIESGLDSLLEGRMPVNIHVSSGNKANTPVVPSQTDPGVPGGAGGSKPVFMEVPLDDDDDQEDEDEDDDHQDDDDDQDDREDKGNRRARESDDHRQDPDDDKDDKNEDDKGNDDDDEDEDSKDDHNRSDGDEEDRNGDEDRDGDEEDGDSGEEDHDSGEEDGDSGDDDYHIGEEDHDRGDSDHSSVDEDDRDREEDDDDD